MLPQQLLPRKVRRPQLTHIVAFAKERSEWIFQPSTIQPGDPHWTRLGQFGESTFSIAIAGLDEIRRICRPLVVVAEPQAERPLAWFGVQGIGGLQAERP